MKYLYIFIIIILFKSEIYAQSGNWVWIKGSDTAYSLGNYGSLGIESPTNEPPSRYEAAFWTDLNGDFWMFGGVGDYNDLWKFNPISSNWVWVKGNKLQDNLNGFYGTQGIPSLLNNPPATGYGANCWTDHNGDLWLYSGSLIPTGGNNILWKYHIPTNEWTWIIGNKDTLKGPNYGTLGTSNINNTPGERFECKSGWVYGNKLWLFGGMDTLGDVRNDLWSFNLGNNEWTWESGTQTPNDVGNYGIKGLADINNIPPARMSYTRWQDADNNFYIFGGGKFSYLNDVWKYDLKSKLWTWISGSNMYNISDKIMEYCKPDKDNSPASRIENQTIQTNNVCTKSFWTFGGLSRDENYEVSFNDLWMFNTINLEWTKIKGGSGNPAPYNFGSKNIPSIANLPPARGGNSVWSDKSGNFYIHGGIGSLVSGTPKFLNDMWKFIPDTSCFKTGIIEGVNLYKPRDTTICIGDTISMPYPKNSFIEIIPNSGCKIDTSKGVIYFYGKTNTRYKIIGSSFNPNDPCYPKDSVTFTLTNYNLPKADFTINPNIANITDATFNFLNQSIYSIRYEWYYNGQLLSNAIDIVKSFNARGKYCLTLVAINECGQRDSTTKCCEVFERGNISIPNAFTPNQDNKNDGFRALLSGPYQKFSLLIMNRYGQEIFKTENPNELWDGRFNNQDQETGVYYYLIKVKFDYPEAKEEIYKGDISLLR